jgi:hypothetical protein
MVAMNTSASTPAPTGNKKRMICFPAPYLEREETPFAV